MQDYLLRQLNPVNKGVIKVLEKIYSEWWDIFHFDTFHLGADEVNLKCYNSSSVVTDYMDRNGIPRTEKGTKENASATYVLMKTYLNENA